MITQFTPFPLKNGEDNLQCESYTQILEMMQRLYFDDGGRQTYVPGCRGYIRK